MQAEKEKAAGTSIPDPVGGYSANEFCFIQRPTGRERRSPRTTITCPSRIDHQLLQEESRCQTASNADSYGPFLTGADGGLLCSLVDRFDALTDDSDCSFLCVFTSFSSIAPLLAGSGISVTRPKSNLLNNPETWRWKYLPSGMNGKLGGERVIGESRRERRNVRS